MSSCSTFLSMLWLLSMGTGSQAACSMTDETCEYWLEIEHHLTMMDYKTAVYPANGLLYRYDVLNTTGAQPVNASNVITADGWEKPRLVIAVNKTVPGPAIEVYEGQTVIVHVKNLMTGLAISIHWHGLHQKNTPWMDGVAFVTQCPILPGQTFTYKFKAYPIGTFWYHAHVGSQLSMGLLGALIVREKVTPPMEEFIMLLQDWNHDHDGDLIHLRMVYGNYENRKKVPPTTSLDGSQFSMFPFQSGLINGKGRFFNPNGTHNEAPLTIFNVQSLKSYRFRVIGAGNLYPFRVSIDEHVIKVIASDGSYLEPVIVESFIINPGERFDFEITADQSINNYWIRAETLEVNVSNHIGLAILRYEGAPDTDPVTNRAHCTNLDRCLVLNCPFSYYPEGTFTDCQLFSSLRGTESNITPGASSEQPEEIEEIFLNFAFPGTTFTPGSVNGRAYLVPSVSALTQPQEIDTLCDPEKCGEEKICQCSYSVDLVHNKVYQMVFLNMGNGKGWAHPIHMHGHSFFVLKMGYPNYDVTTGKLIEENLDINCGGNPNRTQSFCNAARWANTSWGGNNIPGLELQSPPLKDTIMVPNGGYVVVRIRADNPGLWLIHCHIELHMLDGMTMMVNESFPYQPAPPIDFPRCGSFRYRDESSHDHEESKPEKYEDVYNKKTFWVTVGCLLAVLVVQLIVIFIVSFRLQKSKKSDLSPTVAYHNDANGGK